MAPRRQFRKLYLGEWIARLDRVPADIARAVKTTESYLSLLISGKKKNPSARLLFDISEELGITVNDLYRPPPPKEALEAAQRLSPAEIAVLGRLLEQMKTRK